MLVDKLGVPIAPKKNAEIVEPGHDPLQLNAIDEKDRKRSLVFPNVIKKGVLQILLLVWSHDLSVF